MAARRSVTGSSRARDGPQKTSRALDDHLPGRSLDGQRVGGELEPVGGELRFELRIRRHDVGLVVDHDEPVGAPVQEVDVALEHGN